MGGALNSTVVFTLRSWMTGNTICTPLHTQCPHVITLYAPPTGLLQSYASLFFVSLTPLERQNISLAISVHLKCECFNLFINTLARIVGLYSSYMANKNNTNTCTVIPHLAHHEQKRTPSSCPRSSGSSHKTTPPHI